MKSKYPLAPGLFIIAMLLSSVAFGQARVDDPVFVPVKRSDTVGAVVGWAKNNDIGKWVSNDRVIDQHKCPDCSAARGDINEEKMNLHYMQILEFVIQGEKLYVLKCNIEGAYGHNGKSHGPILMGMVMDSNQYAALKDVVNKKEMVTRSIAGYTIWAEQTPTEEGLCQSLRKEKGEEYHFKNVFQVNSQTLDGKDIVRFRLPEGATTAEMSQYFNVGYFECDAAVFKKIFID